MELEETRVITSPVPTREQTAVRLLFVLDRLGESCVEDAPPGAVRVVRAQRKLQKLDFLVRNPDYLADALITAVEEGRLPGQHLVDARRVLLEREPDLHTYRMLRNRFGACEPLDDALALLRAPGLIMVRRAGEISDTQVRRRDYYLLCDGAGKAEELRATVPALAWYDQQAALVGLATAGMTAEQLRQQQYAREEYAQTPLGQSIGGIVDRVRRRLQDAMARHQVAS